MTQNNKKKTFKKIPLSPNQIIPVIVGILLVIIVSVYYLFFSSTNPIEVVNDRVESNENVDGIFYNDFRELDGVGIDTNDERRPRNVAIIVENNMEAWPLSGINNASIVYEALAEGRIPRFMAVMPYTTELEQIGPVRSARTYFVQLSLAFDAPFFHVGGSPDGLKKLKEYDVDDMDQFYYSPYFWRDNKYRYAPHNVYTSNELIQELFDDYELKTVSDFNSWKYKDPMVIEIDEENPSEYLDIVVNYTNNTYQAKYVFDPAQNKYQRYQAKEPLILLGGEEIWVDNVIVEEHPHEVYDSVGRRNIDLLGEGSAWLYRDGIEIEATWRKETVNELTRYYDENNEEIILNRGKTWINIVELNSFK